MRSRKYGWLAVSALAATVATGADDARAETQIETVDYNFNMSLLEQPELLPESQVNGYDNPQYYGEQNVQVDQFDTQGGVFSLDKVNLTLDMTIAGTIQTYQYVYYTAADSDQPQTLQQLQDPDEVVIELLGGADIPGKLTSIVPFDDVIDTPDDNGQIFLNETEDGLDASNTVSLGHFIGLGQVDINANALATILYQPQVAGVAEQGLNASGQIELTYTYSRVTGEAIPTPAAAGMGLALLTGALVRRRR